MIIFTNNSITATATKNTEWLMNKMNVNMHNDNEELHYSVSEHDGIYIAVQPSPS